MDYDFDLFVIGAGSGGVRASRMAAELGKRVAVAENMFLGGTCVNIGCVPKKLFVYASEFSKSFSYSQGYGWSTQQPSFDWSKLIRNKDAEIKRLNGIYDSLLKNAGVKLIHGRAIVSGSHEVIVGDKSYTAKHILIATGSWPMVPEFPGREYAKTSNDTFYLKTFPKRVLIVGGGYIATEFAGIFYGLGAHVTQLYRGNLFLRGFDSDVREHLAHEMQEKGVDLRFHSEVVKLEKVEGGTLAYLNDGSTIMADFVMYATGRCPKTSNLGLEATGVELDDKGAIVVDEKFQSSVPSIYALGDVINRMQLTPVALKEAVVFIDRLYGEDTKRMSYEYIPTAVFSQPNIGTVGYTEEEARSKFGKLTIYRSIFRPMKHILAGSQEKMLMKLIVESKTDRVVGAHIVGPDAGEMIQGVGIAVKAGLTKTDFDATIAIHPTSAEELVTMREPLCVDP